MLSGKCDDAVSLIERAISLAPSDAEALGLSACALSAPEKPKEAVRRLHRAMRLCPSSPSWILTILGKCHYVMGELDLAIGTYRNGVEREPDTALCLLSLANALVDAEEIDEAKAVVENILDVDPTCTVSRAKKCNSMVWWSFTTRTLPA